MINDLVRVCHQRQVPASSNCVARSACNELSVAMQSSADTNECHLTRACIRHPLHLQSFFEILSNVGRDPKRIVVSSFRIPTGIMMKEEALNEYMSRNQNNFFSRQEEANLSPVQSLPHAARGLSSEARTECPCRLAGSWKRPLPSSFLVPGLAGRSPCVPTGGPCCLCIS